MNKVIVVLLVNCLVSCAVLDNTRNQSSDQTKNGFVEYPKSSDTKLVFLDEYIYPAKETFKGNLIGGLSGLDYQDGMYYIVCDDAKTPRYYKASIEVKDYKISNVNFKEAIIFNKNSNSFFENYFDLEGIAVVGNDVLFSSEGSISRSINPSIFRVSNKSQFKTSYVLNDNYLVGGSQEPRHNAVFEGLCKSFDGKGFWVAVEMSLKHDGQEVKFPKTNSPVRFTYYDLETNKATKEFVYELSGLARKDIGSLNISGLSAILEYKKDHFLVLERTYQDKYVGDQNIVKVYKAVVSSNVTNVVNDQRLVKGAYQPMKKELVLDFHDIKSKLSSKTIDNIEGITFGENLPNGNKSVIIISDDNFQRYGDQINQFLLFEFLGD